jgi:DNA helicase HerA-like ATPase
MIRPTDVISIFGQRGSGKTDLGKALGRLYPRLFVIDIAKDWRKKEDGLDAQFTDFDEAADFLADSIGRPQWRAAFSFDIDTKSKSQEQIFEALLRTLYKRGELTGENICLLIEEVHLYCGPNYAPEWLYKMITLGRHANVGMIVSSQRPAQVFRGITSAAPHKFIGQLDEARDLDYFRGMVGELADQIPKLAPYHFLYYQLGQAPQVVTRESF